MKHILTAIVGTFFVWLGTIITTGISLPAFQLVILSALVYLVSKSEDK